MKKVGIVMGSDSDLPIIKKATDTLKALDIPFEVHIYSAHRTPVEARDFALNARANGFGALICAAGMAAHLAGAIAANTTLPVIGIPCKSSVLDGMDALLSTVMMPTGIPVATVPLMAVPTPLCWRLRFWLCPTPTWRPNWTKSVLPTPPLCWPRTPPLWKICKFYSPTYF